MATFRIHRVSKLTGLSKDVIRVWERRYGLIRPMRGANRYRIYTDEDVALLRYLRGELEKGESIGDLAALGREELLRRMKAVSPPPALMAEPYERILRELVASLEPFDRVAFERRLNGAIAVVPFEESLHGILLPLQRRVGELWHDGHVNVAIEHYVTRQVQQRIFSAMNQLPVAELGPKIVVACPPGETHEIGAQAVAYRCRVRGCRVYYLGANVPMEALATLCRQVRPALVLLSYPVTLPEAEAEQTAERLANEVKPIAPVAVGGDGAVALRAVFERHSLVVLGDLVELDERVRDLLLTKAARRED